MCGRFGISTTAEQLSLLLEMDPEDIGEVKARYNIAPSTTAPIVRHNAKGKKRLHWIRWGLVPSWAKSPSVGQKLINARSESVNQKPSFQAAFARRRCLVLSDGFYEWKKDEATGEKQAYHIGLTDEGPFAMAGLWERYSPPEAESPLDTFTILTTQANPVLRPIHHRMPVILPPKHYETWLSPSSDARTLLNLLTPCPDEILTTWPVSSHVNSPKHDDPGCRRALSAAHDASA